MQAQNSLRTLLFGAPLHGRGPGDVDALVAELNACLQGVLDLLAEEIGPCPSLDQATLEWQRLIDAPGGFEGVAVRRAALIFALHLMEAVRARTLRRTSRARGRPGGARPARGRPGLPGRHGPEARGAGHPDLDHVRDVAGRAAGERPGGGGGEGEG